MIQGRTEFWRFVLGQPLRQDDDASSLRRLLNRFRTIRATCLPLRSSLMAAVAVKPRGVGRQIVRDRVLRFNAEGSDGLLQRSGSGRPASEARLAALIARVETGPWPAIDGALATSGSGAVVMGGRSPQRKLPECHLAQTRRQDIDGPCIMDKTGMP